MRFFRDKFLPFLKKNSFFFLLVLAIFLFGLAMQYSADGGHLWPRAERQALRFPFCFSIMIVLALTDQRFWYVWAYWIYASVLALLGLVEFWGFVGMGAQRWIDLYLIQIQPSELMKGALVLALGRYYSGLMEQEACAPGAHIFPLILTFLPSLLVLRQPDLGSALILIGAGLCVIFLAGFSWKKILGAGCLGLCCFPIIWTHLHAYQRKRLLVFLHPDRDPLGAGYHLLQSKIALGSAGFWGKGFLKGTQSHLNFLPEKHTDFIFTMLCEELGFCGGLILLFLYFLLFLWGYTSSQSARGYFGRLLGNGLVFLLFLHIFVNIGMVMGLLPVVGVPLPLVSYGGSSLLATSIILGLLLNVAHHRHFRIGA
ncbi:MAG: rod shape-determining protein RodA [Holosporales bacterium]|jgi:rod shape determining protein RodA|nr:rod shape-determining protein RodA [Holosporales bacterium]